MRDVGEAAGPKVFLNKIKWISLVKLPEPGTIS